MPYYGRKERTEKECVVVTNYKKYSYSFSANIFTLNIHFVQMILKPNKKSMAK